jgi:hypothetical protein
MAKKKPVIGDELQSLFAKATPKQRRGMVAKLDAEQLRDILSSASMGTQRPAATVPPEVPTASPGITPSPAGSVDTSKVFQKSAAPTAGAEEKRGIGAMLEEKGSLLKKIFDRPEAKTVGAAVIVSGILRSLMGGTQEALNANLQGQAMDIQGQAAGPMATEQAMQPIAKAQRDQALMLLMSQLGVKKVNLADGEAYT